MPAYRQTLVRHAPWVIVLLLVLAPFAWWIGRTFRDAKRLADYSAHAALNQEICEQLAAVPPGKPYPESLTELPLAFPDGGDRSMLNRFEYHSDGTSCTLKTELGWNETDRKMIVRSFPADANAL